MLNVSKIKRSSLFLLSNKMLVFRPGIHKMFVRISNREDPDQTASEEAFLLFQKQSGSGLFV